ncbi:Uncharacterized protein APZ42_019544 [Daphnia magna]|uniref:Uncharacterized protein n=1 Tax=Daphnia magna TaxID=35525 RepID=A0A0P6C7L8_9CRUS|nr:Uncharacterized protein APZ42_019544 [Daphnia magna]
MMMSVANGTTGQTCAPFSPLRVGFHGKIIKNMEKKFVFIYFFALISFVFCCCLRRLFPVQIDGQSLMGGFQ